MFKGIYTALLIAVAAALWTPTAQAGTTIVPPAGSPIPYQQWVQEARVPTPHVALTIVEEPCVFLDDFAQACTSPETGTIWFGGGGRTTFYHELGHNFDYYELTESARVRYMTLIGRSGQGWRQPGTFSPHELFAESYLGCAYRPRMSQDGTVMGQEVVGGWRVHNRVCRLIQRVGGY